MFPETWRVQIAPWIDNLVDWLLIRYGYLFDGISAAMLGLLLRVEGLLMATPWWLLIGFVALVAWLGTRKWTMVLTLTLLSFSVGLLGLWEPAMETLAIVITAVILSVALGLPLGIWMARSNRVEALLRPALDAMQTMPSFVYLVPAMMLFGLGKVPAVFATLIYALPPVIRLTSLGIRQVSAGVQEAALAFGASPWQLLREVQLPLAVPTILAGVNQTTMMALSMVVIASMIGARGVGQEVLLAINRIEVGRGFQAGLTVVVLAIVIDRITQGLSRRWEYPA